MLFMRFITVYSSHVHNKWILEVRQLTVKKDKNFLSKINSHSVRIWLYQVSSF